MEQKDRYSFRSMFERSQKSKPIGKIDEKSSSIWKPVTIGSFSAIMFSTISAVVMKQLEEMNREVHSVLKAKPSSDSPIPEKSFEETFAEARQQRGAHSAFTWKGNVYSTATKDEWEQLSETQREEVIEHIDPSALEVLDVNDNYVQNIDDISDIQTIGLDDENSMFDDPKDMVFSTEDEIADDNMAMNEIEDPSVVVIEEQNEDLDDDVHIVSGGNVSDVEVMMQINGNENQDVFIVDVDNDNIDDSFSDVIDASQNQVDISTQVDYVDPNTIDGGEGVTGDDLFFA